MYRIKLTINILFTVIVGFNLLIQPLYASGEDKGVHLFILSGQSNMGLNEKGASIENDLHYSDEGYKIPGYRFANNAIELIEKKNQSNVNLIQHLDASITESIIVDDTSNVTTWIDQSGAGNNAVALSGEVYYKSNEDDKAWLDFGNTQNTLQLFSAVESDDWLDQSTGNGGFCVMLSFKINGIINNWNDLIGNSTAVSQGFGLRYGNSGSIQGYLGGKTINVGGSKLAVGDQVIFAFNYNAASGTYEFWDSKNSNSVTGTIDAKDFSLDVPVTLGSTLADSRYFDGYIGEVKIYKNSLSSFDFKAQRDSLAQKWTDVKVPISLNWRVILEDERFPTEDVVLAAISVADKGLNNPLPADPVNSDCTATFQEALDMLGNKGGGTVFVPEGHYRLDGTLNVPENVTLRGRWRPLNETNSAIGTILKIYNGRGTEENPFITIQGSGGVRDLTFWHPEQDPGNIVPYPFVIQSNGGPITIENITLLNAYKGVNMSSASMCFIDNIQGTALNTGFFADRSYAVSRFDKLNFGPEFWKWAKLPDDSFASNAYESYMMNFGTGIDIREMDGFHLTESKVRGMKIGLQFDVGVTGDNPHGDMSGLDIRNCNVALKVNSSKGLAIVNSYLEGTETGLQNLYGNIKIEANNCKFTGGSAAVQNTNGGGLSLSSCVLDGKVASSGNLEITGCNFISTGTDIDLTSLTTSALIYGSVFADGPDIIDNAPSSAKVIIENNVLDQRYKPSPLLPAKDLNIIRKPAKNDIFNIVDFGAVANDGLDDSDAFEKAIVAANNNNGGIVFIPNGKFDLSGSYTLSSGTELRGISGSRHKSNDAATHSLIQITGNEGNPDGAAFITLGEKCGIRGLTFYYPAQKSAMLVPETIIEYPFTIRGTGDDIYITDCMFANPYQGINFKNADNHLLENCFLGGLNKTIYVQHCDGGRVENFHLKPDFWRDLKMGDYPETGYGTSQLKRYCGKYLHGIWLENTTNQIVYNIFNHASHQFMRVDNSTGLGFMIGGEQLQRGYRFSGSKDFNLVLSICNINNQGDRTGSFGNWTDENFTGKVNTWMCGVEGTADKAYWIQGGEYDSRQNSIGGSGSRGIVGLEVNEGGILNLNAFTFDRKISVNFDTGADVAIRESYFNGLPNGIIYDTTIVLERNSFSDSYIATDLNQNWIENQGLILDSDIKFEDSPMFGTDPYDARRIVGARSQEGEFVIHVEDDDFLKGNNNPIEISTFFYIDSNCKIDVWYKSASGLKPGKSLSYSGQSAPKYLNIDFLVTDANFVGKDDILIKITGDSPLLNYVYISRPISEINQAPQWSADTIGYSYAITNSAYGEKIQIGTHITDPENVALIFKRISGPTWLQISSSGQLGGTPGNSNEGLNTFVVQADDGHGNRVNTTIEIIVKIPTGIAGNEKSKISVYPVPVQNKLHIKGIDRSVKYQIINASGVKIKEGFVEQSIINVESLSPGSYILKLEDVNFKIVKI